MHLGVRLSIGRLIGPKLTSELRPFFTSYLGHIVLAFTIALLYVTGISFLQNPFVSLTLRPGGAYVFRPDTFLVVSYFYNFYQIVYIMIFMSTLMFPLYSGGITFLFFKVFITFFGIYFTPLSYFRFA